MEWKIASKVRQSGWRIINIIHFALLTHSLEYFWLVDIVHTHCVILYKYEPSNHLEDIKESFFFHAMIIFIRNIFLSCNDNFYHWYCKKNVSLSQERKKNSGYLAVWCGTLYDKGRSIWSEDNCKFSYFKIRFAENFTSIAILVSSLRQFVWHLFSLLRSDQLKPLLFIWRFLHKVCEVKKHSSPVRIGVHTIGCQWSIPYSCNRVTTMPSQNSSENLWYLPNTIFFFSEHFFSIWRRGYHTFFV